MKKVLYLFFVIAAIAAVSYSCRKDESNNSPAATTSADQTTATISGMVQDENNASLSGVSVTAYGLNATTDQNGIFLLKGSVNKNRCVIQFTKSGFLNRLHAFIPQSGIVNYVRIVMNTEPVALIISSSAGGTVSLGVGGSVQFQPNSFVLAGSTTSYSGIVSITTKHLAVGDSNFGLTIPGGDLTGKNSANEDVALYSYGMTGVTMKGSSGEALQLAAGTTATITFPVASSQLSSAPATIPLWYLDETTALWKEEGQATKVGNNYVGSVAHFTWWNCDMGGGTATIKGRVVDCEGTPLANVVVAVNGGMTLVTDANGYYTSWVPGGMALTFQVFPQGFITLPSQIENVAPLTAGQVYIVPDLIVPCAARVSGNLTGCNNQATDGSVVILDNGILVNYEYTLSGSFSLLAPQNSSVTLYANSFAGFASQTITSPSASDSINLGTIQLCNNVIYPNSFVLNGDGYNNEVVNILGVFNSNSTFYTAGSMTQGIVEGSSNVGNIYLSVNFTGNHPVNLEVVNPYDTVVNIAFGNKYYSAHADTGNHFFLSITQYGNVGDSVKGTFSGKMISYSDSIVSEVFVSNGRFAILRGQDQ